MHRIASSASVLVALSLAACGAAPASDGSSSSAEDALAAKATPPIPYVLQFTGEYDGDGTGDVDWIVLHANGRFEASVLGRTATGTYTAPRTPGGSVTFAFKIRSTTYTAGVGTSWNGGPIPPQNTLTVKHGNEKQTLAAPWIAGNEGLCDETGGAWSDDDADPATGLYCGCPSPKVYVPSAGGCVAPAVKGASDPARIAPSPFALQWVAEWDASRASPGRIASLVLDRDGYWYGTIDGQDDWGTYWTDPAAKAMPYTFVFAGVAHGFTATIATYGTPQLAVTWERKGALEALTPVGTVGPDESMCDATHGAWTDDDVDPATGLYCVCKAPLVYIPSLGGCVK